MSNPVLVDWLVEDIGDRYSLRAVGLAANQVGKDLKLVIIDIRGSEEKLDEKDYSRLLMPLTLINPELELSGKKIRGMEGCLSFPGIFGEVERYEFAKVRTEFTNGKFLEFTTSGLLARVIQHEVDHLNGVLFIDRMSPKVYDTIKDKVEKLRMETVKYSRD